MNADVEIKIDRKIGDFFINHLRDAKQRLWIMSPWVAAEYMDLAVSKKVAGVDVRVTTTNNYVNGQKNALRKLLESRIRIIKPENKVLKYIGIGLFLIGLISGIYTKGDGFILSILGAILWAAGTAKTEKYWISTLGDGKVSILEYHPYRIVHAKIYVADDWVIMGSVNLTENGMKDNIEAVTVIQSAELATKISEMMSGVKNNLNLKELSYDAVGVELDKPDLKPRRYRRANTFWKY